MARAATSTGLPKAGKKSTVLAILDQKVETKVKHIILSIAVLFACFGLITFQVSSIIERGQAGDLRVVAFANYQTRIDTYQTAVVQYDQCVARIESRVVIRGRLNSITNLLGTVVRIFVGDNEPSPQVVAVFDAIDQELGSIDTELPVLGLSICPPLPVAPRVVPDPDTP